MGFSTSEYLQPPMHLSLSVKDMCVYIYMYIFNGLMGSIRWYLGLL